MIRLIIAWYSGEGWWRARQQRRVAAYRAAVDARAAELMRQQLRDDIARSQRRGH